MFKFLKKFFAIDGGTTIKENNNMARIITTNTGGATLVVDGNVVATYSRARDARRGAARRGLTLA